MLKEIVVEVPLESVLEQRVGLLPRHTEPAQGSAYVLLLLPPPLLLLLLPPPLLLLRETCS